MYCCAFQSVAQWTQIRAGDIPISDLFDIYDNNDTIVAVGYKADFMTSDFEGYIITSQDGGLNWTTKSFTNRFMKSITFRNGKFFAVGFGVAQDGFIYESIDGLSWKQIFHTTANSGIVSIQFVSDMHAYAGGYGNVQFNSPSLFETIDGGVTWNEVSIQIFGSTGSGGFDEMIFFDSLEAVAISAVYANSLGFSGFQFFTTTNGGRTWTQEQHTTELSGLHFVSSDDGFLMYNNGDIKKTSDRGANWSTIHNGNSVATSSIIFINRNEGFAVGLEGKYLSTQDGGSTWISENTFTTNHLLRIKKFGDKLYALGENSIIFKRNFVPNRIAAYNTSKSINIYPNPTSGKLSIDLSKEYPNVTIELTNIEGQIIQTWSFENISQTQLDIQQPKGIYLLHVKVGQEQSVFKVVKE